MVVLYGRTVQQEVQELAHPGIEQRAIESIEKLFDFGLQAVDAGIYHIERHPDFFEIVDCFSGLFVCFVTAVPERMVQQAVFNLLGFAESSSQFLVLLPDFIQVLFYLFQGIGQSAILEFGFIPESLYGGVDLLLEKIDLLF